MITRARARARAADRVARRFEKHQSAIRADVVVGGGCAVRIA